MTIEGGAVASDLTFQPFGEVSPVQPKLPYSVNQPQQNSPIVPAHPLSGAAASLAALQLACRRGRSVLFRDLDMEVPCGEIVWVRGQNGRGKTSLLRLVAGLSEPMHGQVLWGGLPVRRAPGYCDQLVYIGHANALKDDLTVLEALEFLLRIHGRSVDPTATGAALQRLGLHSRRHAKVRTLSQGQRRRAALARLAAEQSASTWILDEPFDALDVDGVARLNELLGLHARRGGRVLLTSHLPLDPGLGPLTQLDLDRYA